MNPGFPEFGMGHWSNLKRPANIIVIQEAEGICLRISWWNDPRTRTPSHESSLGTEDRDAMSAGYVPLEFCVSPWWSPHLATAAFGLAPCPCLGVEHEQVVELLHGVPASAHVQHAPNDHSLQQQESKSLQITCFFCTRPAGAE